MLLDFWTNLGEKCLFMVTVWLDKSTVSANSSLTRFAKEFQDFILMFFAVLFLLQTFCSSLFVRASDLIERNDFVVSCGYLLLVNRPTCFAQVATTRRTARNCWVVI